MDRKDWLLLVIDYAGKAGLTPVQLQKSLFILSKGLGKAVGPYFYRFIPYNYGPFSKEIYSDAEFLETQGLVNIDQPIGQRFARYMITPTGIAQAKTLKKDIATEVKEYLKKLVGLVQSLTFDQLLRVIYREFPKYKINSVFQE